ncbi:pyridoxal phosphate-dependent aminotransferase [Chryseobacterium sp. A301]
MKVSRLAAHLIGSEIIKIGNQVNEMKAQGADIANLTIGDLNSDLYPIPSFLKERIEIAYDHNLTNYPPANGVKELREAISGDLDSRYGLDYSPEDILVAGGSRPLIYAAFQTLVDPGDKVVYPVPSWNNNHYSYLSQAEKIEIQTSEENFFLPTASELEPHLKGATLLALCSPLNPTGTMFSKSQLEEICELVVKENESRSSDQKPLYLLYDQIYALLTFDKTHFNPVSLNPKMRAYTVFIDGSSKCFAATGLRVGWGFGPSEVISKMKALLGHVGAWAPKPEQKAVGEFLNESEKVDTYVEEYKGKLNESLKTLHGGIQTLKEKGFSTDSIEPMGALYLTVKLDYIGMKQPSGSLIESSSDLVFYLIENAGVALVPFSAFGASPEMPWFRASVGGLSLEQIKELFPRLEAALSKLS